MSEVEALLHEREHYVLFGKKDRVAQVDAELARLKIAVEDEAPSSAPETTEESTPRETATPARPRRPRKRAAKKAPAKKAAKA
jgi:hypothetical protein